MKYEILESGHYYHIFNQGNNKESIFFEDKNYTHFLRLLKKYILPVSEIFAYCLLPNHFHLLLQIRDEIEERKASQAFSNFFNAYAKAINNSYGRTGSLFKRKFSRIRVKNEDYLRNLILYIHTNAEHHGIVDDFRKYRHSSYDGYITDKPTNISTDYMLSLFEDIENFKFVHLQKSNSIFEEMDDYLLE